MPNTDEETYYEATFRSVTGTDGSKILICKDSWLNVTSEAEAFSSRDATRGLGSEIAGPADSKPSLAFIESALDDGRTVHVIWNRQDGDTIIGDPKVEGEKDDQFTLESSDQTEPAVQTMNANESRWLLTRLDEGGGGGPPAGTDIFSLELHGPAKTDDPPVTTEVRSVPSDRRVWMREFPSIRHAARHYPIFGSHTKFGHVLDGPAIYTARKADKQGKEVWSHLSRWNKK